MRPYSIDHFLAKELVMDLVDSPENMTYLGIFDNYNVILKHNQKLSVASLEDDDQDHADKIKRLKILNTYNSKKLSESQKITKKIAIFDVENDIHEFENFRFHSHPFNQISGGHLNIVEFMTDTHPVRNYREASDYIKRVEKFNEIFTADLLWLEEQKKQGIFAPQFVFDHVIRQLKELLAYEDKENPLMQVFSRKVDALELDSKKVTELKSNLSKVIASDVKFGFQSILDYMESNYENANQHHGVWSLPNGGGLLCCSIKILYNY